MYALTLRTSAIRAPPFKRNGSARTRSRAGVWYVPLLPYIPFRISSRLDDLSDEYASQSGSPKSPLPKEVGRGTFMLRAFSLQLVVHVVLLRAWHSACPKAKRARCHTRLSPKCSVQRKLVTHSLEAVSCLRASICQFR